MTTIKRRVNSFQSLLDWSTELSNFWMDNKYIQVSASDVRSLNANALQHEWYKILANHYGCDESEIKAYCKYWFGAPILLRRDGELSDLLHSINWEQRAAVWGISIEEAKILVISKMNVTSTFSTEESNEYMDAIKNHYLSEGFTLPSKKDLMDV